jgi:hypothetical protein
VKKDDEFQDVVQKYFFVGRLRRLWLALYENK